MFTVGFHLSYLVIWYAWFFFLSTRLHENWLVPRWCCRLPAKLWFWSGLTVREEPLAIPTILVQLRSIIAVFRVVGATPGALTLVLNQPIKETKKYWKTEKRESFNVVTLGKWTNRPGHNTHTHSNSMSGSRHEVYV